MAPPIFYSRDCPSFCFKPRIIIIIVAFWAFLTFKAVNIIVNMSSKAAPPTPNIPDGRKSLRKPQRRVYFNELQFVSDRDRRVFKCQIQQPPITL